MVTATRGRPRSEQARESILQAALELARGSESGEITISAIAASAGVGRQTIYRWWDSRSAVLLEAVAQYGRSHIEAADSGDFSADLTEFLASTFRAAKRMQKLLLILMADALANPDFNPAFTERFIRERRSVLRQLLQRGIDQGALREATDLEYLMDLVYGSMWYRLVNQHARIDDGLAQQLAGTVLTLAGNDAQAPGGGRRS